MKCKAKKNKGVIQFFHAAGLSLGDIMKVYSGDGGCKCLAFDGE